MELWICGSLYKVQYYGFSAHSRVEDVSVVGMGLNSGKSDMPVEMVGLFKSSTPPCSPRNSPPTGASNYAAMTCLLLTIRARLVPDDPISAPSQRQSMPRSPMLQAAPGYLVRLRYQENGHVTLPSITPEKQSPGQVYVYGTFSRTRWQRTTWDRPF
jgi:hypothetical protein